MKRRKFLTTAIAAAVAPKVVDLQPAPMWINPDWGRPHGPPGFFQLPEAYRFVYDEAASPDEHGFAIFRRLTPEELETLPMTTNEEYQP